ncbi:MAG: PhnD/SsuA/transferrin family substrate-binding protein [Candidatus Obscuribacterales bacterium]|nr:PhnD/SsuA/transferrin family substrate-binding protein [Candidatus Obscuribacterales bacterium]
MSGKGILLGAVAYTAAVVDIWEGIKDFFNEEGCSFDFVLFSNYEAQVDALLAGFIDVAWNTNLAFIKTDSKLAGRTRLLAMRDTDIDFKSKFIARKGSFDSLEKLRGKTVAFGSRDSAQAALMPEYFLRKAGLTADQDYKALRFNSDVGKHGDTGRSELEVIHAVLSGEAAAGAIGISTWEALKSKEADLESFWTSPGYSHCVFNALPEADEEMCKSFVDTLMRMKYENPAHRRLLELEGLKQWVLASRDGYVQISEAARLLAYVQTEEIQVASK